MIVNIHDCNKCAHQDICRYRGEYEGFGERLRNLQLFSPEVVPGNVQDNLSMSAFCKHYTMSVPTARSVQEMAIEEPESHDDIMQRLIVMTPQFPSQPLTYEKGGEKHD